VLPSAGSETVVRIHRGGDGTTEVLDNVGKRWAIVPGEFPQLSGSGDIVSSVIGSSYFLFDLRGSAQSLEGADLCMGASADGSTMLCLGHLRKPDEFAAIWNTQSGRIERRLAVHYPRSPEKGRLTFEGRLNASGSIVIEQSASEAFLTDLRSGAGWTLTSPLGYSRTSFSVDADGRTMAALDKNGALVLADARTGHIERTWPGLLSAEQYNVTLSIDSKGDRIAALDSDLLRLVDTHSGRLRQRPNNGFHKAAFSADGRSLLTYLNQANDDQVEVFSTEDLAAQPIRFRLSRALSEVVAFSEGRIIGVKRGVLHHSAPLEPSAMLSDLCHRLDSMNLMREGWTQRAGNTPYVSVCPRQDTPQGNKP